MAVESTIQDHFNRFLTEIDPRKVLIDVHETIAVRPVNSDWQLRPGATNFIELLLENGFHPVLCTWESPDSVREVISQLIGENPALSPGIRVEETHYINRSNPPNSHIPFFAEHESIIPTGWRDGHWTSNKWPPGFGARIIIDDEYDRPFGLTPSDLLALEVKNNPLLGWTGIPAQHEDDANVGFPTRALHQIIHASENWQNWHDFLFRK